MNNSASKSLTRSEADERDCFDGHGETSSLATTLGCRVRTGMKSTCPMMATLAIGNAILAARIDEQRSPAQDRLSAPRGYGAASRTMDRRLR